jgi:Zn-finger nucleic acid-binding protein
MQCPAGCDAALVMSERQNVEIDYCPSCRGVWLDRGELDKILERATQQLNEAAAPAAPPQPPPPTYDQPQGYQQPQSQRMPMGTRGSPAPGYGYGGHPKKKKSFLSEMFDF